MRGVLEALSGVVDSYFSKGDSVWWQILELVVAIVGIYGLFLAFLFIVRYILIYIITRRLMRHFSARKYRLKAQSAKPTNREDELLRSEKKERQKAEKVEVERMNEPEQTTEEIAQEFQLILPKVIGKWTALILRQKGDLPLLIAKMMKDQGTPDSFWRTMMQIQRQQAALDQARGNDFVRNKGRER